MSIRKSENAFIYFTDYKFLEKPPIRLWVGIMIFFTTFTNYMTRVNLSVSIVAMSSKNSSSGKTSCTVDYLGKPAKSSDPKDYQWSEPLQAQLLAAYFYGYIMTCLPAGLLVEFIGPFNTIFYSSIAAAVLNSLSPYAPLIHEYLLFVIRLIMGALAGPIYPSVQMLMVKWAPPVEKGKFMAAMMGNTIGIVVTWSLTGFVSDKINYQWGFHVVSIIIGLFCVVFFFVVADSPQDHRWVSEEEKAYIAEQLGNTVSATKKKIPPYLEMFKSIRFIALAVAHFGNMWGLYLITINLPKFISQVYAVNMKALGAVSCIPYILRFLGSTVFGSIGDFFRKRDIISPTFVRKFFIIFSHVIPGLLLISIGLMGCNFLAVIALVSLSQFMNGAVVISHLQNPQDLAPNFAATIYGIISFIGGTPGFIVPSITGAFTKDASNLKQWSYVFAIGGSAYALCGVFFIVLGTAKLQSWNEPKSNTTE